MMERKRFAHMNLSVKIKKEEEDPVLYISCSSQDKRNTRTFGRQIDWKDQQSLDDGVHSGRTKSNLTIARDSVKERECRHRWTKSEDSKLQERNNGRITSSLSCHYVDSKCYSMSGCFKELSNDNNSWSSEQVNAEWQTEKRFRCEFCKSKFTRRSSLNRHMECIHRDVKMYGCDICHDQFPSQTIRDKHRDLHLKSGKLYRCTVCEKAFQYPEMLVRHTNWHRKEEDKSQHRCFVCELSFNKSSSLATHMEHCHNMKSAPNSTVLDTASVGGTEVDRWRKNNCSVPRISKVYSIVSRSDEKDDELDRPTMTISEKASNQSCQLGHRYLDYSSGRPKLAAVLAQTDASNNTPAMHDNGDSQICHQNGSIVCSREECVRMPMDNANRDINNSMARKVVAPVAFINGTASEVRTKSSLKRKLLNSLASRREVAFANAKRRVLGTNGSVGQSGGVNMETYGDVRSYCNVKTRPYGFDTCANNATSYERNGRKLDIIVGKRDSFINNDGNHFGHHRSYERTSPNNDKPMTVDSMAGGSEVLVRVPLDAGVRPTTPRERHDDVKDYDEVYECPKCGKDYQACRYMETHLLLHDDVTDLPCHFCAKKFISKKDLDKHVHTRHTPRQRLQKKGSSMVNKTLKADVDQINRVLNSAKTVPNDIIEVTAPLDTSKESENKIINKNTNETMENRKRDFDGNENFTENSVVPSSLSRNFKCGFCTLTFAIASELEEHICAHLTSKPFRCALCTESFSSIYYLEQHLQDHREPETFEGDCADCVIEPDRSYRDGQKSGKEHGVVSEE